MSSSISYEYLTNSVLQGSGFTADGGTYHTYTNASGGISVGNMCVIASQNTEKGVTLPTTDTNIIQFIGVTIESGIANGSPIKVVTDGNVRVQVDSSIAVQLGNILKLSSSYGKVVSNNYTSSTTQIGVALETVAQGTPNATVLMKLK